MRCGLLYSYRPLFERIEVEFDEPISQLWLSQFADQCLPHQFVFRATHASLPMSAKAGAQILREMQDVSVRVCVIKRALLCS